MRSRSDKNEGLARVGATWPRKAIAWVVGVALVGGCVWLAYSTLMPQRSEVVAIPVDQPAAPVAQVPTQAPPEVVDLTGLVKAVPPAPVAAPVAPAAAPTVVPVVSIPPPPPSAVHIAPVVIPVDPEPVAPVRPAPVPPAARAPAKAPAPAPSTLQPVQIPE